MQPSTVATEARVHAEKVQVLARNLPFTAVTGVAIALLAAAGSQGVIGLAAWQWAAAFILVALLRLAMLPVYWRSAADPDKSRLWGYILTFNTLLSGLMWAVFGVIAYVPGNYSHGLFVAIIQTGLTAASLASLSAYTPALLSFAVPTMGGFIVAYASSGERPMQILALMAGVFLVVMALSSRAAERVLSQSIRLRFDNQRLIDELKTAKVEAEAANVAKSDFLAMMSHELRTPMNSVVAMAELVDQTALDGEQRGMVSIIRHSAESMLSIIGDILDLSRIEAGRLSLDEVPFDLATVVEDVAQIVAPAAGEKNLEVVVDIDPAIPERLWGDPARLRQILLNLAGNAVKFTDHGHILLAAEGSGDGLHLLVADTGPGITAEAQTRLFNPFTQADNAVARRYGGTGLGLSICKRLVELMGGHIAVDSAPGQGSRFYFTVPMRPAETAVTPPPMPRLDGCRLAVLVQAPLQAALERLLLARGAILADHPGQADFVLYEGDAPPAGRPGVRLVPFHHLDMAAGHTMLRKPVRANELLAIIAAGTGRASPPPASAGTSPQAFRAPDRRRAEAERSVILVAEDNLINRIVLSKMLDRLGMVYDLAEDGRAALGYFRRHDCYGLVLTDFHMPEMDGVNLARAIRAGGAKDVPIIALTADALPQTGKLCAEAGMQGQLIKPLRQQALEEILARWLPRALALRQPGLTAPPQKGHGAPGLSE